MAGTQSSQAPGLQLAWLFAAPRGTGHPPHHRFGGGTASVGEYVVPLGLHRGSGGRLIISTK